MRTIALLAVLLACGGVGARFVIEEGGLKVVLPPEAKSQYPKGFDVALANFGERQARERARAGRRVGAPARGGGWAPGLRAA